MSTAEVQGSAASRVSSSPNEIGWLFVPQYYTFVNKDPARLHCFYTKRSTFVHGTEGEEATVRHGQQEIHEHILSLGFNDCKVYVGNVDSQSSADGGIIVQVLGEMSNNGSEWRKFAQTFFLAEQPNGYFVLNDIFRYIKEESEEHEEAPVPGSPRIAVPVPQSVSDHSHPYNAVTQAPDVATPHQETVSAAFGQTEEVESARRSPHVQHQVNGWHHSTEPPALQPEIEPRKPSPVPQIAEAVATEPEPVPAAAPEPELSTVPATASAQEEQTPAPTSEDRHASQQPAVAAPVPTEPSTQQPSTESTVAAAPPVKKTWANLAASSGAWKTNVASTAKGVSAQVTPPVTAQQQMAAQHPVSAQPVASTSQPPSQQPAMTPSGRPIPNIASITHPNCFVKNVQEQVTDEGLRRTLETNFGPIKELDIVRSKACAFLEFKFVDSAKKAIQFCSPHSVGGHGGIDCDGMFLHIEERKPKGDPTRLSGAPRGGGRTGSTPSGTGRGASSAMPAGGTRSTGGLNSSGTARTANTTPANRGKPK